MGSSNKWEDSQPQISAIIFLILIPIHLITSPVDKEHRFSTIS